MEFHIELELNKYTVHTVVVDYVYMYMHEEMDRLKEQTERWIGCNVIRLSRVMELQTVPDLPLPVVEFLNGHN